MRHCDIQGDVFRVIVPIALLDDKAQIKVDHQPLNRTLFESEILDFLNNHPQATIEEIADVTGRTLYAIKTTMKQLKNTGALYRQGAKKNGRWIVVDSV